MQIVEKKCVIHAIMPTKVPKHLKQHVNCLQTKQQAFVLRISVQKLFCGIKTVCLCVVSISVCLLLSAEFLQYRTRIRRVSHCFQHSISSRIEIKGMHVKLNVCVSICVSISVYLFVAM